MADSSANKALQPALLPWGELMRHLIATGKVTPRDFWRLSLPELDIFLQTLRGEFDRPLSRTEFEKLKDAFPDNTERQENKDKRI